MVSLKRSTQWKQSVDMNNSRNVTANTPRGEKNQELL